MSKTYLHRTMIFLLPKIYSGQVFVQHTVTNRGGVLDIVRGLEDTFPSPWPWPRSLKSSKIALSSARGQHYFWKR